MRENLQRCQIRQGLEYIVWQDAQFVITQAPASTAAEEEEKRGGGGGEFVKKKRKKWPQLCTYKVLRSVRELKSPAGKVDSSFKPISLHAVAVQTNTM